MIGLAAIVIMTTSTLAENITEIFPTASSLASYIFLIILLAVILKIERGEKLSIINP